MAASLSDSLKDLTTENTEIAERGQGMV